jgi:hypothetical protein
MDYRVQLQHVPEQTVGRCSSSITSTSTTSSRVFRVARRHGSQDAIAILWFRDGGTTGTTDRHHGYGREIATGTRPRSDGIQKKNNTQRNLRLVAWRHTRFLRVVRCQRRVCLCV